MSLRNWNATPQECAAAYPCDRYLPQPYRSYHRAVDVAAPVPLAFRWLCQLKLAPYSYDWIDNLGRRSPRQLTPGVDELAVGQPFLVFAIVEFEPDRHITGRSRPEVERIYGPLAVTYQVAPRLDGSRYVVRLNAGMTSVWARLRAPLLGSGDTVMMRKQLLNLKQLAERDAAAGGRSLWPT